MSDKRAVGVVVKGETRFKEEEKSVSVGRKGIAIVKNEEALARKGDVVVKKENVHRKKRVSAAKNIKAKITHVAKLATKVDVKSIKKETIKYNGGATDPVNAPESNVQFNIKTEPLPRVLQTKRTRTADCDIHFIKTEHTSCNVVKADSINDSECDVQFIKVEPSTCGLGTKSTKLSGCDAQLVTKEASSNLGVKGSQKRKQACAPVAKSYVGNSKAEVPPAVDTNNNKASASGRDVQYMKTEVTQSKGAGSGAAGVSDCDIVYMKTEFSSIGATAGASDCDIQYVKTEFSPIVVSDTDTVLTGAADSDVEYVKTEPIRVIDITSNTICDQDSDVQYLKTEFPAIGSEAAFSPDVDVLYVKTENISINNVKSINANVPNGTTHSKETELITDGDTIVTCETANITTVQVQNQLSESNSIKVNVCNTASITDNESYSTETTETRSDDTNSNNASVSGCGIQHISTESKTNKDIVDDNIIAADGAANKDAIDNNKCTADGSVNKDVVDNNKRIADGAANKDAVDNNKRTADGYANEGIVENNISTAEGDLQRITTESHYKTNAVSVGNETSVPDTESEVQQNSDKSSPNNSDACSSNTLTVSGADEQDTTSTTEESHDNVISETHKTTNVSEAQEKQTTKSSLDSDASGNNSGESNAIVSQNPQPPTKYWIQTGQKGPVDVLANYTKRSMNFEVVGETEKLFTTVVTVSGEKFEGVGRSKKASKANAAQAALLKRFNVQFLHPPGQGNQSSGTENVLAKMNRLKPGLSYTLCSVTGKNPNRLFTMSTVVDGKRVTGSGTSILRAKRATAKKALALLNNSSTSDPSGDTLQATTDNIDNQKSSPNAATTQNKEMRLTQMETGSIDQHQNEAPVLSSTVSLIQDLKIAEHEKESPVSLLYKATQLQFKISPSWMGFTAEVEIDGEKFRGHGRSKKLSKANAARAALTKRFNIQFFKNTVGEKRQLQWRPAHDYNGLSSCKRPRQETHNVNRVAPSSPSVASLNTRTPSVNGSTTTTKLPYTATPCSGTSTTSNTSSQSSSYASGNINAVAPSSVATSSSAHGNMNTANTTVQTSINAPQTMTTISQSIPSTTKVQTAASIPSTTNVKTSSNAPGNTKTGGANIQRSRFRPYNMNSLMPNHQYMASMHRYGSYPVHMSNMTRNYMYSSWQW